MPSLLFHVTLVRRPAFVLLLPALLLLLLWSPAPGLAGWVPTGSLTWAREWHTATLLPNGKVLAVGGINSSYFPLPYNDLYDPATRTWGATADLATKRTYHTATRLASGKVLVVGGQGTTIFLKSAEIYDPATGIWPAGNLATGRQKHEATLLLNGKVLVTGGLGSAYTALASAELYDPTGNSWTTAKPMATKRAGHSATLLANGKVLVAGGYYTDNTVYPPVTTIYASCELYDPDTDLWSPAGSLPMGWASHKAVRLQNGKVLIAGGVNGQTIIPNAALYDPDTDRWTPTGGMSLGRGDNTITLLNDGKVLVTGGITTATSPPFLATCELYDPETGLWSPAPPMLTPRTNHTATLLTNGDVLVAGGLKDSTYDGYLASAEIYQIPKKGIVTPLLFLLLGN